MLCFNRETGHRLTAHVETQFFYKFLLVKTPETAINMYRCRKNQTIIQKMYSHSKHNDNKSVVHIQHSKTYEERQPEPWHYSFSQIDKH